MRIVFRTDASLEIGSGHVFRCLSLAHYLRERGAVCHFICREQRGDLIAVVRGEGYVVHKLVDERARVFPAENTESTEHSHWLSVSQTSDATECIEVLRAVQPDWLIVDHYALDASWEVATAPYCRKVMAIDDLADRPHACDLLLDQNIGKRPRDYTALVPDQCQLLTGTKYALLRPEFAALRNRSLHRRKKPQVKRLLVNMGGVDKGNATGTVLQALKDSSLPDDCRIDIVMGATAPWLESVRDLAASMAWRANVAVNVKDMALQMAQSDLAIGAAGSTSWERCCMGLPTLSLALALNQEESLKRLAEAGAVFHIRLGDDDFERMLLSHLERLCTEPQILKQLSAKASALVDGKGGRRVVETIGQLS